MSDRSRPAGRCVCSAPRLDEGAGVARPLTLQSGILSARNAENARTAKKKGLSPRPPQKSSSDSEGGGGGGLCHPLLPLSTFNRPFLHLLSCVCERCDLPSLTTSGGDQGPQTPTLWNLRAGLDPTPSRMTRLTFHRFQLTFNKGLSQRIGPQQTPAGVSG